MKLFGWVIYLLAFGAMGTVLYTVHIGLTDWQYWAAFVCIGVAQVGWTLMDD